MTQQSTGTVSLIHSVTFKREEGDRARLVLIRARLAPGWSQTRAYCRTGSDGQCKHLLIKVGCLLSAARKRQVAARLGLPKNQRLARTRASVPPPTPST